MSSLLRLFFYAWCAVLIWELACHGSELLAEWNLNDMVTEDSGRRNYHAQPVDAKRRNLWPAELEVEFQQRAEICIGSA